jgi:4-amino-4-deoxy-L-arabinose transferase-like glycosyltransferase
MSGRVPGPARLPRREMLLALLGTLVWLAWSAGLRALELPDEGRYVGVAWEAIRGGQWLEPLLNGQPFFHKPPLFYWITEIAMSLFGVNQLAGRAAPVLGGWLAAVSLYLLLYRWAGATIARVALAVLLALPMFFLGAQYANLDMLVAGCITATLALTVDALLRRRVGLPWRATLLAAYASAGVGILAKGLIGIVLPGLIVVVWLLALRRWRDILALLWLPGIAAMLAVAAPWYALMQQRHPEFLHFFFVVQHLQRFASTGFNNVQPFWFFPAVLLVFHLPALPWLALGWGGARRRGARARQLAGADIGDEYGDQGGIGVLTAGGPGAPFATRTEAPAEVSADPHRLIPLLLSWLTVVVVFFSLPQSKLVGYILPAVPPIAALTAIGWQRLLPTSRMVRRAAVATLLLSALAGVAIVITLAVSPHRNTRELARDLAAWRADGEPIFSLGRYDYDLPFYARLREPMVVAEDWSDPEILTHDNWRKELAETRDFAPGGRAPLLIDEKTLPAALCAHPVNWVIAASRDAPATPWLKDLPSVSTRRGVSLWRITPVMVGCPR